jgi:3-hydroxybutyryl-CoA dehydrogenase
MRLDDVQTVGLLGGGVMGGGISQVMALAGFRVICRDVSEEIIAKTRDTILNTRFGIRRAVEIGRLDSTQAEAAISNLNFTTNMNDLAQCDFIIEAVPERLELKQQVFKELDAIVKPEAVFTSNTSGYVIAEIARDVSPQRKTQCAGMHYFSPVPAMKALEVIYIPDVTSPETIACVRGVGERAGKIISMVRDTPGTYGFLVNRIYAAARREADKILEEGIASEEDIDNGMKYGRRWPVGIYESRNATRQGWL